MEGKDGKEEEEDDGEEEEEEEEEGEGEEEEEEVGAVGAGGAGFFLTAPLRNFFSISSGFLSSAAEKNFKLSKTTLLSCLTTGVP